MARILVIDDEPQLRKLLRRALTKLGHEVIELEDGRNACPAHLATPFDLVITDLVMPEYDGLRTISELIEADPELRIIAMSGGGIGSGSSTDVNLMLKSARHMGAVTTLEKPFELKQLGKVVDQALIPQPPGPAC